MEKLKDPCNDRQVKSVPLPPAHPLDSDSLFHHEKPDLKVVREHLLGEGMVTKNALIKLL
jgi:serine/threonine-protein phosphatase 2B catalytic subunit